MNPQPISSVVEVGRLSALTWHVPPAAGLAREHNLKLRTAPGRYGTITHMAPETITDGVLNAPCDVYAWGVLLWEMLTGGSMC